MKLVIEKKDVEMIKLTLINHFDLIINNKLAKQLIEMNPDLANELYEYDSLDTFGRELLINFLVRYIMKNVSKPKNKITFSWEECYWEWPIEKDSEEYKKEFFKEFKCAALKHKGIKFGESWVNK